MMEDFAQPEDRVRFVEVGNNKLFMKRVDPYGFVYVNYERGELPQELKGAYTSFEAARTGIQKYLAKKDREASEVKTKNDSA
jgi:hypothetical protein